MHTSNLKTTSKYSFILSDRGLIVLHFYIFTLSFFLTQYKLVSMCVRIFWVSDVYTSEVQCVFSLFLQPL